MKQYKQSDFNPFALADRPEKEKRKQYSEMRSIARKRLERLAKSYPKSEIYIYNKTRFTPLKEVKSTKDLDILLSDLAQFLNNNLSTIKGQKARRQKTIDTLRDRGYTFVNAKNFDRFTQFMDATRKAAQASRYDSERVYELFTTAERIGINPLELQEDFQYFMEKQNELDNLPIPRRDKPKTAEQYRQYLKKYKKRK